MVTGLGGLALGALGALALAEPGLANKHDKCLQRCNDRHAKARVSRTRCRRACANR
jgi:hypothetical protein